MKNDKTHKTYGSLALTFICPSCKHKNSVEEPYISEVHDTEMGYGAMKKISYETCNKCGIEIEIRI